MMRTTHYAPLAPCPHGERTDRTTTDGRPLCPLCRHATPRPTTDPNLPDWAGLAAGDDTHEEDELRTPCDPLGEAVTDLFASLFDQDNRIETMLDRWTIRDRDGMLF